jgi:hypothetical protein
MSGLKERLENSKMLLDIIDRSRLDNGDPTLAANIERMVVDRAIADLEDSIECSGSEELVRVRVRFRR